MMIPGTYGAPEEKLERCRGVHSLLWYLDEIDEILLYLFNSQNAVCLILHLGPGVKPVFELPVHDRIWSVII